MNLKRYEQIKQFPTLDRSNINCKNWLKTDKNRNDLKFYLKENNDNILKNIIWNNIFKEYISSKIIDDDLSLDQINDLKFKLLKTEWIIIPTWLSIYKILHNMFLENILLPDYVEWWEKEDVFKELNKILKRVQWRTFKILDKMNKSWFFNIEVWSIDEIQNELDWINWEWWYIEHRIFDIWWIFWLINIWESSEINWKYSFEIPIRIPVSKKQTTWKKEYLEKNIKPEEIENILNKYFKKWKNWQRDILPWKKDFKWMENFFITTEKKINKDWKFNQEDLDTYYVISIKNSSIEYLSSERNTTEDIYNYLKQYFKIAKLLINEIWAKSEHNNKKRYLNFSTMYFYDSLIDDEPQDLSQETLEKFWKMLVEINEPVKLEDVWWQKEAKMQINKIIKSIKYEAVMKSWWSKTTSWIIFEWPPGTWKTLLARAIASEVDWLFYNIKLTDIASSAYINEWSNNLQELFKFLRHKSKKSNKKIIVNLDEMEALFKKRDWKNNSWEDAKIVNTFLSEMWWFEDFPNIIFIWTTNLKESLDPAVIRSWRMSTSITVDLPDEEARKQIFQIHLNKASEKSNKVKKIINWIDFQKIGKESKNLSWADIEEIIRILIEEKAIEEIEKWKASIIKTENFLEIINEFIKKSENSKKIFWKINSDNIIEKLKDNETWWVYRQALISILWAIIEKELNEWVLKWKIISSDIETILNNDVWNWNKMGFSR
jgi:SpoVK/Ycf46/Vps4 family AAA+-type ATPase